MCLGCLGTGPPASHTPTVASHCHMNTEIGNICVGKEAMIIPLLVYILHDIVCLTASIMPVLLGAIVILGEWVWLGWSLGLACVYSPV